MEFFQYFVVFVKRTGMTDQQNTRGPESTKLCSYRKQTEIIKIFENTSAKFGGKKNVVKFFLEAKLHWKHNVVRLYFIFH